MNPPTQACTACPTPTVSDRVWRKATKAQRVAWRKAGTLKRGGRGLCTRCYSHAWNAGSLAEHERRTWSNAEVLQEWQHFRQLGVPIREQVRQLAPRMGMTWEALERALYRAGVVSEFPDGWNRKDGCAA